MTYLENMFFGDNLIRFVCHFLDCVNLVFQHKHPYDSYHVIASVAMLLPVFCLNVQKVIKEPILCLTTGKSHHSGGCSNDHS